MYVIVLTQKSSNGLQDLDIDASTTTKPWIVAMSKHKNPAPQNLVAFFGYIYVYIFGVKMPDATATIIRMCSLA